MRKSILLTILFILALTAYFSYVHFTAADLPTFGLKLGGQKSELKNLTKNFLESIKFKNIDTLKSFISKESLTQDLEIFFKKTFDMSYQEIDLEKFSIEETQIDSTKSRCKIKVKLMGTNQITKEPFSKIRVLYWYFDTNLKIWLIDIKNNII